MKNTRIPSISPAKRLLYALVGLLAGDLILLFFLLQHALHATDFMNLEKYFCEKAKRSTSTQAEE